MNRSTLSALVVALMLGSGIAGYLIGKPDRLRRHGSTARPHGNCTGTDAAAAAAAPQRPPRRVRAHAGRPADDSPAPAAPAEAFAYRRLSIDNSAAEAEACLFFNKPLATGDTVKYADYVRIAPEVKSALRVVDDKLCIGGLTYGQDYSVTLLAGLPSADGSKLADERKVELALGPRPAVDHPAGQGLHPAARHRRRPADHHGQRRQARHLGLSRERARPRQVHRPLRTRASPAPSRRPSSTRCASG